MGINKADKAILTSMIKRMDVQEMYASEVKQKRAWFRFGAYDALRMVVELIQNYPEEADSKEPKTKRINIT